MTEHEKELDNYPLSRADLILAGLGGMGVLSAGRLLASAGLACYEYVSWMPGYGEARRGGLSECTVILSAEEIASPILDKADTVILLDGSQFRAFEERVNPGGNLIVEIAGLRDKPRRSDLRLLRISGLDLAMAMGGVVVNSLVLLGFYVSAVAPLPPHLIEQELCLRYEGDEVVRQRNIAAFKTGLSLERGPDDLCGERGER